MLTVNMRTAPCGVFNSNDGNVPYNTNTCQQQRKNVVEVVRRPLFQSSRLDSYTFIILPHVKFANVWVAMKKTMWICIYGGVESLAASSLNVTVTLLPLSLYNLHE